MSGGLMSCGLNSGGLMSGGLKSYDQAPIYCKTGYSKEGPYMLQNRIFKRSSLLFYIYFK